jgi:lysophospholipase L1-like esterase
MLLMQFIIEHKVWGGVVIAAFLLSFVLFWQVFYITHHYTASVPAPQIPRIPETFGLNGPPLQFVVMGDSTSIGQGAEYEQGIARMSARLLAQNHTVTMTNVGISGARVADVRSKQLAKATALKPDLVLRAVGANDVTHLTLLSSVRGNTQAIIAQLQVANPKVHIILTGSPAMGSVARFALLTQWAAGTRVRQVNGIFAGVAAQYSNVLLLPLAKETGYAFKHNPSLFAADNFHPNAAGYAVWQPVVTTGLQTAGEF